MPYAELEEEVANYHINNIKNGLSPSMLINFNNGIPTEEERELIERRIIDKFSGTSNSGKFILAFNDNKEMQATIEPVQLSDASQQYEFLSEESSQKLMVGHRITSPMLLGIKDGSGLGSNADEIKTASLLFQNTVIRSTQEMILDAMDELLAYNDISLNLYFKTLQPLEFIDYEGLDDETAEEQTGRKFSADDPEIDLEDFLEQIGEDEPQDEEYELIDVDSESTEDEPEDFDVEGYLNSLVNLSAKEDSSQDSELYKVRYTYVKGTSKTPDGETRDFCRKMLRTKKLYRKEDIGMMSARV